MTQVCTIQELYKVVPDTAGLEGRQFKDQKELITAVIEAVETSGKWEFVQYIQANPSLFVVRPEVREMVKVLAAQPIRPIADDKTSYKAPDPLRNVQPEPKRATAPETLSLEMQPSQSTFEPVKLPWKS